MHSNKLSLLVAALLALHTANIFASRPASEVSIDTIMANMMKRMNTKAPLEPVKIRALTSGNNKMVNLVRCINTQTPQEPAKIRVLTSDDQTVDITASEIPYFGVFRDIELDDSKPTIIDYTYADAPAAERSPKASREFNEATIHADALHMFSAFIHDAKKLRSYPEKECLPMLLAGNSQKLKPAKIYHYIRQAADLELNGLPLRALLFRAAEYLNNEEIKLSEFPARDYYDELAKIYFLRYNKALNFKLANTNRTYVPALEFTNDELAAWGRTSPNSITASPYKSNTSDDDFNTSDDGETTLI